MRDTFFRDAGEKLRQPGKCLPGDFKTEQFFLRLEIIERDVIDQSAPGRQN